jgi:hypothetical protein
VASPLAIQGLSRKGRRADQVGRGRRGYHGNEARGSHPDTHATSEELVTHCREHLAAYKVPRIAQFVDQVPMTASEDALPLVTGLASLSPRRSVAR